MTSQDVLDLWKQALRSDKYKQGFGFLRNERDEFCAFGVLCDVVDASGWSAEPVEASTSYLTKVYTYGRHYRSLPPSYILRAVGIPSSFRMTIWIANDDKRKTFSQIADRIEMWEKQGR